MKNNYTKFFLSLCAVFFLSLGLIQNVNAKTSTRTSSEYVHLRGSTCSMTTVCEVSNGKGTLIDYSFNERPTLGYSFKTNAPSKVENPGYVLFISSNTISFMGSTTWDFKLDTDHPL